MKTQQYVVNVSNEEAETPLVIPVMKFGNTEEKKENESAIREDTTGETPLVIPTIDFSKRSDYEN